MQSAVSRRVKVLFPFVFVVLFVVVVSLLPPSHCPPSSGPWISGFGGEGVRGANASLNHNKNSFKIHTSNCRLQTPIRHPCRTHFWWFARTCNFCQNLNPSQARREYSMVGGSQCWNIFDICFNMFPRPNFISFLKRFWLSFEPEKSTDLERGREENSKICTSATSLGDQVGSHVPPNGQEPKLIWMPSSNALNEPPKLRIPA